MRDERRGKFATGYDREQIGRLLHLAFPVDPGSFAGLMSELRSHEADGGRLIALGFVAPEEGSRS